jgi:hypothetical protein
VPCRTAKSNRASKEVEELGSNKKAFVNIIRQVEQILEQVDYPHRSITREPQLQEGQIPSSYLHIQKNLAKFL